MSKFGTWLHAHVPAYMLRGFSWFITVILVIGAVLYAPSASTFFFLPAALLVCPARPLNRLAAANGGPIPLPGFLVRQTTPLWLALTLITAGSVFLPKSGDFTLSAFLDVQFAHVAATGTVEYGREPIDASTYLSCSRKLVQLTPKTSLDARELGTHTIVVTLAEGGFKRNVSIEMEVMDTKAPLIKVREPELYVKQGDTADIFANIVTVYDPVEGPLELVSEQPVAQGALVGRETFYDKGWFIVTGVPADPSPGTYNVVVLARDKHGNETVEGFTVTVQ